jgi:hypothetical protein
MDIQDGQDNEKGRMEIFITYKRLTVEYNVKEHEQNISVPFESLQQAGTDS